MPNKGFIRDGDIWTGTDDLNKLLLAPVQDAILCETVTELFAGSRSLFPIPEAYEPLLHYLPNLSMLGRINGQKLTVMPVPCVLRSENTDLEDIDFEEGGSEPTKLELAKLLAQAGPLLMDIGEFSSTTGSGRRGSYPEITLTELRGVFSRSRCLIVDNAENYDSDEIGFTMPPAWSRLAHYERNEMAILRVNHSTLEKRLQPPSGKPRRPRKPRPKAPSVDLYVSDVVNWINDLRYKSKYHALRCLDSGDTRDLDACWRTMKEFIPVIETLFGKYAYRRCQDYREAYKKLMAKVMTNPVGCIRKMWNINKSFACWLELETQSKEAQQIQRNAFLVNNGKHGRKTVSSLSDWPEDYNNRYLVIGAVASYDDVPRCLRRPLPEPVKGANEDGVEAETTEADATEKEPVPAEVGAGG